MEQKIVEFTDFVKSETIKKWDKSQSQLLLSSLLPSFKQEKGYEFALEKGTKLRRYIDELIKTGKLDGVKVFEPSIKAKVGLIPKDQELIDKENTFEYEKNKKGRVVFDFLDLIDNNLSEKDKEKIDIPLNILLKLINCQ